MPRKPNAGRKTNPLTRYRLGPGLAAIATEIYLPQKYALDPDVVKVLRDSMNPDAVRAHFASTSADPANIRPVLTRRLRKKYPAIRAALSNRASLRSFGGYSIASIVGGFKGPPPAYDANAVIRILDWPIPPPEILAQCDSDFFQRVVRTVFGLRRHNETRPGLQTLSIGVLTPVGAIQDKPLDPTDEKSAKLIYDWLENWMDEQTVMLYGFVLYRLALATGGEEDEIMLTSHFEVVHRLAKRGSKRGNRPV